MNDRQKVGELLAAIDKAIDYECVEVAKSIVGKNQNPPPQGVADGSFSNSEWTAARDAVNAIDTFQSSLKCFRR